MEDYMTPYIVYVRLDERNLIAAVNSSAFLLDVEGWTEIDRGYTQNHHHAQGNYFEKPIYDDRGIKRYKAAETSSVEGDALATFPIGEGTYGVYERTQEEMDADYAARPAPPPSDKERIAQLEAALTAIGEGIASV